MEGLKAAIEFITELKEGSMEPKVLEINGNTYCNKNLTRYHYFPKADSLSVNTLTSIVDYIKGKPEELRETMILHVISPTEVRLYSGLVDERNREELMRADAIVNEFRFDRYYDQERFLIEQPQSSYVFRIQDSDRGPSFKLVEADGGLWKNATMKKIKEYLAYELAEELEKYHITIIA